MRWPIQTTIITFIFDVIMDQFSSIRSGQCPRHHPAAADWAVHHFQGDLQCNAEFSAPLLSRHSFQMTNFDDAATTFRISMDREQQCMIRETLELWVQHTEYYQLIEWNVWHHLRRMENGLINSRNWLGNSREYFMNWDSIGGNIHQRNCYTWDALANYETLLSDDHLAVPGG